jgi:hypothetical protein
MLGLTSWLAEVCNILLAAHCVIRKEKQLITICWHLFSHGSFGLGYYKGWGFRTSHLNGESLPLMAAVLESTKGWSDRFSKV